jgi:serine/threonine protein kinase
MQCIVLSLFLGEDGLLAPTKARRSFSQVGCHWSLAVFYFAEAIEAIEHMHRLIQPSISPTERFFSDRKQLRFAYLCPPFRRGIVHRDIKPENMIIASDGYHHYFTFQEKTRKNSFKIISFFNCVKDT